MHVDRLLTSRRTAIAVRMIGMWRREDCMLIRRIGLALVGARAIATLVAMPASAVDTIVLFTTTGGALNITTPVSATLTGGTNTPVSGRLGTVTVTDSRGTATGWLA